jgi:hypothetical protein
MGTTISVRLDDLVHSTLERAAKARGIGLSTYLRNLAADEAARILKAHTWEQGERVGRYIAVSPEGKAFYEGWGTPSAIDKP